jgi:hypothetical protein
MSSRMSQRLGLLAALNPASVAAGTVTTGWVDASKCEEILAVISTGALGANGTVDAKMQQATSAAGAGAKDIANKAIAQLTQAGSDKSNKQVLIDLQAQELDVQNGFQFVRLSVTTATAASQLSAVLLGSMSRFGPPDQATSVSQTVA